MPYISKNNDRRKKLRKGEPALLAGELNYQIFHYAKYHRKELYESLTFPYMENKQKARKIIEKFVSNFLGQNPNYQKYNDMTGCLIRCYKEIDRRLQFNPKVLFEAIMNSYDDEIAKYEDIKIKENGDVE